MKHELLHPKVFRNAPYGHFEDNQGFKKINYLDCQCRALNTSLPGDRITPPPIQFSYVSSSVLLSNFNKLMIPGFSCVWDFPTNMDCTLLNCISDESDYFCGTPDIQDLFIHLMAQTILMCLAAV